MVAERPVVLPRLRGRLISRGRQPMLKSLYPVVSNVLVVVVFFAAAVLLTVGLLGLH
jgi:hypothetical protein